MLIRVATLEGIRTGAITAQFRRWTRPRVRKGTVLRTAVGLVRVTSVDTADPTTLSPADAARAGYLSVDELLDALPERPGDLFRIGVEYDGPDPRVALREAIVTDAELPDLTARLDRFDRASPRGAWTRQLLALIDTRPGVRAEDLAKTVGWDKAPFKTNVRKLKELGLTESLETGYRLSRRGRSLLDKLS